MIRTFDSEAYQQMSTISLVGVTHLSKTCTLPPLVGLIHTPTLLPSDPNSDLNDLSLETGAGVWNRPSLLVRPVGRIVTGRHNTLASNGDNADGKLAGECDKQKSGDMEGSGGGSAIFIVSSISLSVKQCFFCKCRCNGFGDDGGAICVRGNAAAGQYFRLDRSSFSECTSNAPFPNFGDCASISTTPSVTINDSFFEKSSANYDGALALSAGTHSILFNCAFVLCSSAGHAGAVGIHGTATLEFSFVQFRQCSSTNANPNGRDVLLENLGRSQVSEKNFTFCDSTSAHPNVYFVYGYHSDSDLVPEIQSTPDISDIDIQFDEEHEVAVVSVTASEAIRGTMGILLNGCIVPRLIHVVFGTDTGLSQTGSAVVSSGPNGILPNAEYQVLNHSFAAVFLPPRLEHCVCSLHDAYSCLVILTGSSLMEGDYQMKFKKGQDGEEKEIALTWVNASTLHGSVSLYSSSATDRLEWDSEYEVTCVVGRTQSEEIQIELSRTLKFSTPKEPIRIEGANCTLGGSKEEAGVVEFWGVGLSSGKGNRLKVKKEKEGVVSGEEIELTGTLLVESESGSFLHTEEIFGMSSPLVSYGETYLVVGIVVGGEDGVVNANVRFSVPAEPSRLTKMTASDFTDAEKTQMELSFETRSLKASTTYEMILKSIVGEGRTPHEKRIVVTTSTSGEIEAFSISLYPIEKEESKRKGQLEFGTRYEVKSIDDGSGTIHIETADTLFSTPDEPVRIEGCVSQLLSKDRETVTLLLTGRLLTSSLVSVCLSNGSHKWIPLHPINVENHTHCLVEFVVGKDETTSTLSYGKKYSLQQDGESANFIVNSGILVYVPNPPILREIKFSFANSMNTSCFVEVSGSDLVASTGYNVTLNSFLCVVIHFSSSTSGRSGEIQIGWEGGLKFDTEYTVTSIVPLDEDDGDIRLLESVSGKTGKRTSSLNLFTDSSSSEESPFCGEMSRACCSISEVWKIVTGLSIVRQTIEIVDSVRMKDGIRIVGGMHVVIRNGTSSEPSLIVPSSFSLDSLSAVIVVEATGFLEIRNVNVSIGSSDSSFVFLSATRATILLRDGPITGPTSPSLSTNEADLHNVCSWTSGVLQLTDCATTLSHQDFTHLSQGVINMNGGSLSLVSSLFSDNSPNLEPFSSFRRNLICSDSGSIEVGSLSGGDGTLDHPHLWMAADECTMTGEYAQPLSPLFVPSLSETSTTSFDKKKELFEVEVKGSTLIPCGLFLEVFEMMKEKKEGENERFQLNNKTITSFTETAITLTLPSSSLRSLNSELEWRGRLIFGKEQHTDEWFVIQKSSIERRSESVLANMKWWLPLVIVVAVVLLTVIVIVILCVWRRRKNGKKEDKEPLISTQEMEVEKYEVMDDDADAPTANVSSIRGLNGNTMNTVHWTEKEHSEADKKDEEKEEREIPYENRVCGLSCGEKSGVVSVVDKAETLYRRLHVLKLGVDRRWAQLSVARGLSHAMNMMEYSAILTELTSHSVVVSGERTMSLILKSDSTQPDPVTEQHTQQNEEINENRDEHDEAKDTPLDLPIDDSETKPTHPQPLPIIRPHPLRQSEVHRDDVRWQAPEEEEERDEGNQKTEGAVRKEIDRRKVSVFRLGLVLWEIETGQIPFLELDGVNAHRNLSAGTKPKMDGIGEKMKGLIEECLSVNPDDRPSVDAVISRLASMDGMESTLKAQHIALS
ncbi:hypothetical protein BLNAU_15005 [Blattamonas nauphoetae]|uniref:Protein kinase domain-containing protein n=1 Tax=Blattamonas nauphoetae TaxID=2049346 RepID=A0ABQ9XC49_9EUKA|nr:hypothetical protein BLNAU_15005 [Blattamonas nauphoetae]